ncbi:hypothetical protein Thi970DRAFT_03750 [Thiorhodovibrio frisius]|uniref:Uncharacterized protein n=1 Tax=Thiorhodovibrio frisius TaxID=631362 RepID=H8Z475_9GAMM|nr:hypothetical protein Thi970DRAFT_03750 [Thiorhodovibrio frisius]WPL20866.1 hypothetical protein Thiofri_00972 [Thiorhodovibrio frisius]
MASVRFEVKYYYITPGTNAKTAGTLSGTVNSQSETLVMQKLRDKHKGKEIVLRELKWK